MMTSRRRISSNMSSPEPALYETFIEIYTNIQNGNNYQNFQKLHVIPIYRIVYNGIIYQKRKYVRFFILKMFL